jgi:DNA-binding transcriptional MerR regulator
MKKHLQHGTHRIRRRAFFSTIQVARAVGVHPNTVRLYEQWGFLRHIPRNISGYRLFTEADIDQMRFARTALHGGWPGHTMWRSALALVRQAATGDLKGAAQLAEAHLALAQEERVQAESVVTVLERWAQHRAADTQSPTCHIGAAARILGVSPDSVRGWERDGMVSVPRDVRGYRLFSQTEMDRLRIIRLLLRAGYSSMAVLRMLLRLDHGDTTNLRRNLDTPRDDEDPLSAADQWLTFLTEQEQRAHSLVLMLQRVNSRPAKPSTRTPGS